MINGETKQQPLFNTPINFMIDLETTGTKAGCGILSIGATVFLTPVKAQAQFYCPIEMESNEHVGLEHDTNTLDWWKQQDEAVRKEAFSGKLELAEVLQNFANWMKSITTQPIVWGNAASFDIKVLEAAFKACGIDVPWSYRDEMCYRTLKSLFAGQVIYTPIPGMVKHHPLWDAVDQASHAEKCYLAMANITMAAMKFMDTAPQEEIQNLGIVRVNSDEALAAASALEQPLP